MAGFDVLSCCHSCASPVGTCGIERLDGEWLVLMLCGATDVRTWGYRAYALSTKPYKKVYRMLPKTFQRQHKSLEEGVSEASQAQHIYPLGNGI